MAINILFGISKFICLFQNYSCFSSESEEKPHQNYNGLFLLPSKWSTLWLTSVRVGLKTPFLTEHNLQIKTNQLTLSSHFTYKCLKKKLKNPALITELQTHVRFSFFLNQRSTKKMPLVASYTRKHTILFTLPIPLVKHVIANTDTH